MLSTYFNLILSFPKNKKSILKLTSRLRDNLFKPRDNNLKKNFKDDKFKENLNLLLIPTCRLSIMFKG